MPQAAFADSTTAPEIHPHTSLNIDDFSRVVQKIEALAFMVGTALDGGRPHEDIRNGIAYLLEEQSDDLRSIFEDFRKEKMESLDTSATFAVAVDKLQGTPDFSQPIINRLPNFQGVGGLISPAWELIENWKSKRQQLRSCGRKVRSCGLATPTFPVVKKAVSDLADSCGVSESTLLHVVIVQWLLDIGKLHLNTTMDGNILGQEASA